jgi:predicted nuclease of predicted toxin-antitoxin system
MIRLLLDQGLPRSAAERLRQAGVDAIHTGDCNLATASDTDIIQVACQQQRAVITLDADFHSLLALSAAAGPSVVRIRIEGLRAETLARIIRSVLERCDADLQKGSLVTVTESGVRVHHLPIGGPQQR